MQSLPVVAAIVNQTFTGELGTTLVLLGLTVFNAVLGRNQESKAEASLAALEMMMKSIARAAAVRPRPPCQLSRLPPRPRRSSRAPDQLVQQTIGGQRLRAWPVPADLIL